MGLIFRIWTGLRNAAYKIATVCLKFRESG
jgi:hypothetical protein